MAPTPGQDNESISNKITSSNLGKTRFASLTKESSLWDIYKASSKLPVSWFNQITTSLILIILALYVSFTPKAISEIVLEVRSLTDTGFNFATSILGFLIAGFTILTTLNKPSLFMRMAKRNHKSGLSYLKYNFFTFVDVFIRYIGFVGLCFSIKILGTTSGPLSLFLNVLHSYNSNINSSMIKFYMICFCYIILGSWFYNLIAILGSFIFNVYYIAMTSIRWELEESITEDEAE